MNDRQPSPHDPEAYGTKDPTLPTTAFSSQGPSRPADPINFLAQGPPRPAEPRIVPPCAERLRDPLLGLSTGTYF